MKYTAGVHGFGRFGQHLLRYWTEHAQSSPFEISYIHDAELSIDQALDIVMRDRYLGSFYRKHVRRTNHGLEILLQNNRKHQIQYTSGEVVSWVGQPDIFFECSGRHTDARQCKAFLKNQTKLVIISAASLHADALLVYGYNHDNFKITQQIISYGSCTVNAFVPLAHFIHQHWGVIDADVHVVHNTPEYLLEGQESLLRKSCTLEQVAPALLEWCRPDNFAVVYTLIPYTGVSIMDIRFRLRRVPARIELLRQLKLAMKSDELKSLYTVTPTDTGPDTHKFTRYSAVLIQPNLKIVGDNLYIHTYFDNENSVNRFFDLATHSARHLQSSALQGGKRHAGI